MKMDKIYKMVANVGMHSAKRSTQIVTFMYFHQPKAPAKVLAMKEDRK